MSDQQQVAATPKFIVDAVRLAIEVEALPRDQRLERLLGAPTQTRVTAVAMIGVAASLGYLVADVPMTVMHAVLGA